MNTQTQIDPIDELIPPPRPRWLRLVIGIAVVALVGTASAVWDSGALYPNPQRNGSGSGTSMMSLAPGGKAVRVAVYFFNQSGRDLLVSSAHADLPGATVLDVAMVDLPEIGLNAAQALPHIVGQRWSGFVVVTFVPTSCDGDTRPWGTIALRLNVANGWLPSFGNTYSLPVVDEHRGYLVVLSSDGVPLAHNQAPRSAACALLGRTA